MASNPRIERASLGDGIGWLTNGGNLLARGGAPMVRIALVLFLFSLLQIIPLFGMLLFVLITPALTAGMLNVFRAVEQGETPTPAWMLAGLTDAGVRTPLLGLGVVFLLGMLASLMVLFGWLSPQMDLAELTRLANDPEVVNNDPFRILGLFEGVNVFGGVALSAMVVALVLSATYFAAPLVFFWHWPVFAALLFSLRAVLANWIAFLGFGLVVIGVALLIGLMVVVFGGILQLALASAGVLLTNLMVALLSLGFQLLMAAAQWKAFTRIFPAGHIGPRSEPPSSDDGPGSLSA